MKIISFGEILWDVFGETKTLGGAPLNFASHCARLGAECLMISAVGSDENGAEALALARESGVNTEYVAVDRRYPTGVCNVTLTNGLPQYELVKGVAYDHIPPTAPRGNFDALYMGTLAMRSADSRRAFRFLAKNASYGEVLFDMNLRGGFYTRDLVTELLHETTILKISSEEMGFFGYRDPVRQCMDISEKYPNLKYILVTLGADGAFVYDCTDTARRVLFSEKPQSKPVSTVGAGDSFAACFLVNLLAGKDIGICLDRAVMLSDYVVTQLGAVPDYDPALFAGD